MKAVRKLISKLLRKKENSTVAIEDKTKKPNYLIIQHKEFCPKTTTEHTARKYKRIRRELENLDQ